MLPRVVLFNAVSLDGQIEGFALDIAQFYELASRWKEDATLAGADTILLSVEKEKVPEEDERAFEPPQKNPNDHRALLVIPDSRGRVRCWRGRRGRNRPVGGLLLRGTLNFGPVAQGSLIRSFRLRLMLPIRLRGHPQRGHG